MEIHIKSIPMKEMRYPSCDDYWETKKGVEFRIAKQKKWEHEAMVLIHAIVEYFLAKKQGIKLEDIDNFDIKFEKDRLKGKYPLDKEPGDDVKCPYRTCHFFATTIERLLCREFKINWEDYENDNYNL